MGELMIRRNRGFAVPQRQEVSKAEKPSGTAGSQKVAGGMAGDAVSKTLRQLMSQAVQMGVQESRRALQTGEGVLAEVREKLDRMAQLAQEAAKEDVKDRPALQKEFEQLGKEIDRMTGSAVFAGMQLFQEGEPEGAAQAFPEWLTKAMLQGGMDSGRLLAALGLNESSSSAALLAALAGRSLESDPAAGYLAALYLGAVIAGASGSEAPDPAAALNGLQQLFEKIREGFSLDEAVELLTGGEYASLADFQTQFTEGTIPGLKDFLAELLLSGSELPVPMEPSLLDFLAGMDGMGMDLLAALLTAGQTSALEGGPEAADLPENLPADLPADGMTGTAEQNEAAQPAMSVMDFGEVQVMGRDLSAVVFDAASGKLTIGGTADVVIQGAGQGNQEILLTGSGTVTLQSVRAASLTVDAAEARIVTTGENTLGEVQLGEKTALTMDGRGLLRTGAFRGGEAAALHLTGGAVAVTGKDQETLGTLAVPVLLDGAASLAARAASVRDLGGKTMEPFDILWETLLPGFRSAASMTVDGRQARMALLGGEHGDPARLWLAKGDPSSQGYPAHALVIRGRDEAGRPRTRYAYLCWDQRTGAFQKTSIYPNPFSVTGGEEDRDWFYEEESHTLHILSSQVTAVSGGSGVNARQEPFSGRIVLTDQIGALKLALGGVVCRVSSGQAFHLGRENDVTLVVRSGTNNCFESGAGCAGISLGEGTSLRIDCTPPGDSGESAGTLTATGGAGGAGIGQDSGAGCERPGHIMIRGGMVTGGEKPGAAGSVTIVGSTSSGGAASGSDLGSAKTWARMSLFLQMGEDAVILPQFPLSSRTLQLNKLRISTREYARAARITIDAGRRWVSRIQTAYSGLSGHLEQGFGAAGQGEGLVRDSTAAGILMHEISRSAPILSDRAMQARSLKSLEEVNRLLR